MPADLLMETRDGDGPRLLLIEPYLTASHKSWAEGLLARIPGRWTLLALAGRHFRWRMRGAGAFLARAAGDILARPYDGLVCSSLLDLAGLKGLVPSLAGVPCLVYFHENQLAYPAAGRAGETQRERDLFLAFANLTSVLAARRALFNSRHHRQEFLAAAEGLLARLPDAVPPGLAALLAGRSGVLPVPVDPSAAAGLGREPREGPLRILWNHRWSQDKAPEEMAAALGSLAREGRDFRVAVLGPDGSARGAWEGLAEALGPRLAHLGGEPERRAYWRWLFWADLAVSCARQEYEGLAMLEAAWAGCRPLVPDALVYPELYPPECRYQAGELPAALGALVDRPELARQGDWRRLAAGHTWEALGEAWRGELAALVGGSQA